jgi:hypothetical protein
MWLPLLRCWVCSRFTFDLPKTKCIVHDGDRQDVRLLLLSQEVDPQGEQQHSAATAAGAAAATAGAALSLQP